MTPRSRRVLGHAVAVLAGALAGACGSFLQAARADVGAVWVPYGVAVALAVSVVAFVASGLLLARRSGALAAVLGWALVVALMLVPRAEGDLVLPDTGTVYVWLYAGTLAAVATLLPPYPLAAAWLRAQRPPGWAARTPPNAAPADEVGQARG